MRLGHLLLGCVTVVAGCRTTTGDLFDEISGVFAGEMSAGDHEIDITHDERERYAWVHVPPQIETAEEPLPVLIALHGQSSQPELFREWTGLDALANREGIVVIYPAGTGASPRRKLSWNASACCGSAVTDEVDDVGFVIAVLDELAAQLPLDETRVYVTGFGNGAMMAHRLAHDAGDRLAAIAPVGGVLRFDKLAPVRPVPVLQIHSTDDPVSPYDGGETTLPFTQETISADAVTEVVLDWAASNGCAPQPQPAREITAESGHTAVELMYLGCVPGAELIHWRLGGAGHVWPGRAKRYSTDVFGAPTDVIDANAMIWEFVSAYRHEDAPELGGDAEARAFKREIYPERDRPAAVVALGRIVEEAFEAPLDRGVAGLSVLAAGSSPVADFAGAFGDRRGTLYTSLSMFSYLDRSEDQTRGLQVLGHLRLQGAIPELPSAGTNLQWWGGNLGVSAMYLATDKNIYYVYAGAQFAEDSDTLGDPQVLPIAFGFGTYRIDDVWTLIYGGGYTTWLGSQELLPIAGVAVTPHPDWRIVLFAPASLEVAWDIVPGWNLAVFGMIDGRRYRITNQTLEDEPRIVKVRLTQARFGASLRADFSPDFSVVASGGVLAPRWVSFAKKKGEIVRSEVEPAPFGSLAVEFAF